MSICPNKDLYSAYVDDELPEIVKQKLESHIKKCLKCKKVVENYEMLKKSLNTKDFQPLNLNESLHKLYCKRDKHNYELSIKKNRIPKWFTKSVRIPIPALIGAALFFLVFMPGIFLTVRPVEVCTHNKYPQFKPILPVVHMRKQKLSNTNKIDEDVFNNFDVKTKYAQTIDGIAASFSEFVHLYLPQGAKDNVIIIGLPYSGANGVYYNFSGVYDSDFYEFLNNVK